MDHVVVVGAGIGGLGAVLAMSRIADRVTLVERSQRPSEVGAAIALQANGMAVLDRAGLLATVNSVAARIDRMDIKTPRGRILMAADVPDFGDGLDHAIAVRRTDLHETLLDAALSLETVHTRFGWRAISADPAGALTVRADGPSAETTTLEADLIIGADGVSSIVRTTGGFASRVSTGTRYVRAIVAGQARSQFEEYWTKLGSFGQAPLGPDMVYFWAAAQSAAAADAVSRRDVPALARLWRDVLPVAGDLLDVVPTFDDLLVNTVRRVDCRRWHSGRLVLLGDAAHAMPPNVGQGANSALVDGIALARRLAEAPSVAEALTSYDRARRPAVRRVQSTASVLQYLCGLDQVLPTRVRDAILAGANRIPHVTDQAIRRAMTADVREVTSPWEPTG